MSIGLFRSLPLVILMFAACSSLPKVHVVKDPLTPREHLNLGVAYERRGEIDAALKQYGMVREGPLLGRARLYAGNALATAGDGEGAEKEYRLALQADPELAEAYNNLAWLYLEAGVRLDEARALAQKAVQLTKGENPEYRDTLEKAKAGLREDAP